MKTSHAISASTALAVTLALLGTAGCGSDKDDGSRKSKRGSTSNDDGSHTGKNTKTRGPVSVAQANALVDRYQKTNNKANKTRSADLNATIESGALRQQSLAQFRQHPALEKKEQRTYGRPFTYTDRNFHIPADRDWFMADVAGKGPGFGKKDRRVLVFDRGSAGGKWKMVAAVNIATFPKVSKNSDGTVQAAAPTRKTGALAPAGLAASVNDLMETGGNDEARSTLANTSAAKTTRSWYTDRNKNLSGARVVYKSAKTPYKDIYALKTDKGVVTVFNGAVRRLERSTTNYIRPSKITAVYTGPEQQTFFQMDYLYQGIATIPDNGKAQLLGRDSEMTNAASRPSGGKFTESPPRPNS
ncbi:MULTISPECIES: hypothetical protein [unclassified Streptomyces]|uniref:hypothetical protein n=1 Tax=unclassified Streptomyces TaxID=2593676 RepID=UPI002DDC05AD|nr:MULTISPECIES: hypothetical protein [unclassified Streptomyces]WSA93837.1 hypothetical protein OIE63_21335 [Streptomyces sp. NBC_01795]WSS13537.1 hypothetical protein OG533_17785 [Streptomyces sp. NBC_01186]WSS42335.1 hypothetical protein OG220_18400 [Streptomyces sp. NBC_01187]